MIHNAATVLVSCWAENGVISKGLEKTYVYGVELLLSAFINLALMFGISTIFGHPYLFIPYLFAFIPIRLFAGGAHAKKHLSCIAFNTSVFLVACFTAILLEESASIIASATECGLSFILVYVFSPVPARNKPLNIKEKQKNRLVSLAISCFFSCICLTAYYTQLLGSIFFRMLFHGQLMASCSLLGEKKFN